MWWRETDAVVGVETGNPVVGGNVDFDVSTRRGDGREWDWRLAGWSVVGVGVVVVVGGSSVCIASLASL